MPLLAGILDLGGHLKEENENYKYFYEPLQKQSDIVEQVCSLANLSGFCSTNYSSYAIISGNKLDRLPLVVSRKRVCKNHDSNYTLNNRDMTWKFNVREIGLGPYYGFKVDGNERILLADLTVSHNVSSFYFTRIFFGVIG